MEIGRKLTNRNNLNYWVDEVGISNFILMRLYLFGEYNGPLHLGDEVDESLQFSEEKNIEKAIAFIPEHVKFFVTIMKNIILAKVPRALMKNCMILYKECVLRAMEKKSNYALLTRGLKG